MPNPPTGTVTFLFTDIEGSTKRWDNHPEAMKQALARHDALLHSAIEKNGGYIFKTVGDAFYAAFPTALNALAATLDAQQALRIENWNQAGPILVRMALHTGSAELRDGDYFGPPLNRVARLLSSAAGGQIVLSNAVYELIYDVLPQGVSVADLGEQWFKGLSRPEHVFELMTSDTPTIPPCPYRGLFAFQEQDAPFFHGREAFTAKLVEAVQKKPLVAVIGSSGSGKSSVVFAGLVPALRRDGERRLIAQFRPSDHPFQALAAALIPMLEPQMSETDRLVETKKMADALRQRNLTLLDVVQRIEQKNPTGIRFLLIVDQFEELYTLCQDVEERQRLLDVLLEDMQPDPHETVPNLTLVITLRADFLGHALSHRPFVDVLQDADLKLGPMTSQELRVAIEKPAHQMNVEIEEGLTERILEALGEEPGDLPLLEFALTLLWERQRNFELTHAAYDEIGGVERALAQYAEEVYDNLSEVQQQQVQRIFTQLVQPGEGTEDTRRLALRDEVREENWDLVARLADARLVISGLNEATGETTVEIVHEALISGWDHLRQWIEADRTFRTWQERLRASIRQWEISGKDEGALLRGAALAEAEGWLQTRQDDLSQEERAFIQSGITLRERERAERERQQRRFILLLAAGLLVSVVLTIWALVAQGQAANATNIAVEAKSTAEAETARADEARIEVEGQRKIGLSRQLAAQALNHADDRLDLALLLSLEAYKVANTIEARGSLLDILASHPRVTTVLRGPNSPVLSLAFAPNGKMLASGSGNNTIILWDVDGHRALGQPLTAHTAPVRSLAFSRDGELMASGGEDKNVILWNVDSNSRSVSQPLTLTGHTATVWSVAFSPNGKTLASGSADNNVILWDVASVKSAEPVSRSLTAHNAPVYSVAFSPDGKMLAAGDKDGTITLWEDLDGARPISRSLTAHTAAVRSVAFSPRDNNGKMMLASGSADHTITLWQDLDSAEPISRSLTAHGDAVWSVAFSPDGKLLASGSQDHTAILWDVADPGNPEPIGKPLAAHGDAVWSVAFSPDGKLLASGSWDSPIVLWDIEGRQSIDRVLNAHTGRVRSVAFSPDGRLLASGSDDKSIALWDVNNPQSIGQPIIRTAHTDSVQSVAFSPDGRLLASGSNDKSIALWNVSNPQSITQPITYTAHITSVRSVAFSPLDGKMMLASGSNDMSIALWNLDNPQSIGQPITYTGHISFVRSIAFSPNGKILASGDEAGAIILWDLATRHSIGSPLAAHSLPLLTLAFSPDGKLLASGSDDHNLILWNVDNPDNPQSIGQPLTLTSHLDSVRSIAFSRDGRLMASGSDDNHVILWDLATRQPIGSPLTAHTDSVDSVAFSPNSKLLASSSADKNVILWDVDLESWQARACRIANRDLTQAEWRQYLGNEPYHETCPNLP